MPDIALIGDRTFLYEKLFGEAGVQFQFIKPGLLGTPFLPQFRAVIIPTGFANSQYSSALRSLRANKDAVAGFVRAGGVLVVYGPLVPEHDYDWLPLPLKYAGEYCEAQQLSSSGHKCACLCSGKGDCDGHLIPGNGFEVVLRDSTGRPVLAAGRYGEGLIVATTVHEFPSVEFVRWAAERGRPAKI